MGSFENVCLYPDVFEGAGGDLIICQEWPSLKGDEYVRVMIPMRDARRFAAEVLAIANAADKKRASKP